MCESQREDFASRCGTNLTYLRFIAYKAKVPSADLSINIERESGGLVRCESLRPAVDWAYIRGTEKAA